MILQSTELIQKNMCHQHNPNTRLEYDNER